MAIARITGPMLQGNLERLGTNLSIDATAYFDVNNRRLGIATSNPQYSLDIAGNAHLGNLYILGNTITTDAGYKLNLGNLANITINGGSSNYVTITDGLGNLSFVDANVIPAITLLTANAQAQESEIITINANILAINAAIANINSNVSNTTGNNIPLGANTVPAFVSNAVTLTASTSVTNAISELNYVLGKLVPPAPPNFPNATTISLTTATITGLMTSGWTPPDNSGWGNLNVIAGTSISAVRSATFTTSAVTNVGPGSTGTVSAYVNGVPNGNVTLTGTNSNTTNGNIYVYNVQDYHNVSSAIAPGFWTVFSTYATAGAGVPAGWNRAYIYDSGTASQTNNITWYYDASTTGTPVFSNTSIVLLSNSVSYSSGIPHFNTSTTFKIKGNVSNLSGDLYLASPFGTTSGGAFATPTVPTYSSFVPSISTPLTRNFVTSSYFETVANIASGFGSSSSGPSVSFTNPYATGSSGTISPGVTVLYKTGTGNAIEETSIPVAASLGTGSGNGYRIVNPDSGTAADNPVYTGSEATWNSQTSTLLSTDATVVASVLKNDVTNYSAGYLPVGPNLSSGRNANQYFTFKFIRAAVSKFDIALTTNGTSAGIAGIWVAVPGSNIDTTAAPTNGWINMAVSYAGSGVPGTGTGGNGSAGCSTGGAVPINTTITGGSYTCTFGTSSSSGTATNEIYVRIKLTSGQSISSLSIALATH